MQGQVFGRGGESGGMVEETMNLFPPAESNPNPGTMFELLFLLVLTIMNTTRIVMLLQTLSLLLLL